MTAAPRRRKPGAEEEKELESNRRMGPQRFDASKSESAAPREKLHSVVSGNGKSLVEESISGFREQRWRWWPTRAARNAEETINDKNSSRNQYKAIKYTFYCYKDMHGRLSESSVIVTGECGEGPTRICGAIVFKRVVQNAENPIFPAVWVVYVRSIYAPIAVPGWPFWSNRKAPRLSCVLKDIKTVVLTEVIKQFARTSIARF